jgi:hypothetical protein
MDHFKKYLTLILLILILLVPAIHKLIGPIPPDWFVGKFKDSLIGILPGGISLSYGLIILLEILGPVFLLIAMFQMLTKQAYQKFLSMGFITYYILFMILTFGSFLVQDYDNGFKDFMYFIAVLVIERFYFSKEEKS